jgi:organic hydroperoxide reductase OsmC/OhrA
MLTFLAICARKRLVVDAYDDEAVGTLEKGENGKLWMAHVALRPRVRFAHGVIVDKTTLDDIHHHAHQECFIALSVKTEVAVEPQY